MNPHPTPDWDPHSPTVQHDQRAAYDRMLARCPVAYSEAFGWSLFRHRDIVRVLHDHASFSNIVSTHVAVPNGMDPPTHTVYRRLIEPYFAPARIAAFEPACREIAIDLVQTGLAGGKVAVMDDIAQPFAARVQGAFLGWPPHLLGMLLQWTQRQQAAARARHRPAMAELAREFDCLIDDILATFAGAAPTANVTAELMHAQIDGRPLRNDEIASILRNWTAGEIGTISASVGILAQFLVENADLQRQLRSQPALLPEAIDEILRLYGPLVLSRRVAACPVEIGGRQIAAGDRLTLMWMAGNRDGDVFDDPHDFRWGRDPGQNLLYGAGIHVCPGAPLARMELRVMMEELLARTASLDGVPGQTPTHAACPESGYATLPMRWH